MHAAMLRFALGYKCAFASREVHTEHIYGNIKFLSTQLKVRRLAYIAHTIREHMEGRAWHPFVTVLSWDFWDQRRRSARVPLSVDILHDAHVEFPEQLFALCANREQCKKMISRLEEETQSQRWEHIWNLRHKENTKAKDTASVS